MLNAGPHGLSEVLYAFMSAGNNNGSAFAGLSATPPFYNTALGLAMLLGRFLPIVLVLALAGSLARQQPVPETAGTLPTHRPLFVGMLVGVVAHRRRPDLLPRLALGPSRKDSDDHDPLPRYRATGSPADCSTRACC